MPAVATIARPGSAVTRVALEIPARARFVDRRGPLCDGRRRLAGDVGHAESPADAELLEPERHEELGEHLHLLGKGLGAKHLASNVGMYPHEAHCVVGPQALHRLCCRAGGEPETEFRVLLAGPDELVGMRLDARSDPDEDGDVPVAAATACQPFEAADLVEAVHYQAADADFEAPPELGVGLVVPVQNETRHGYAGRKSDVHLPACRDVEPHAFLVRELRHRLAQERLRRVCDSIAPGGHRFAAAFAHVKLVVYEKRRAELVHQLQKVDAANRQSSVLTNPSRRRKQVQADGLGIAIPSRTDVSSGQRIADRSVRIAGLAEPFRHFEEARANTGVL